MWIKVPVVFKKSVQPIKTFVPFVYYDCNYVRNKKEMYKATTVQCARKIVIEENYTVCWTKITCLLSNG